jgi:hypothetical protein
MHFKIYPAIGFYYGNKLANFGVPILDENRCFILSLTFINLKYGHVLKGGVESWSAVESWRL